MPSHPAVVQLIEFFAAMQAWERKVSAFHRDLNWEETSEEIVNAFDTRMLKEKAAIFEKYCLEGINATHIREGSYSWGPVETVYDPVKEEIDRVFVNDESVVVETRQTHDMHARFKYEMVLCDGRWKVRDNRKIARGDRWVPYQL